MTATKTNGTFRSEVYFNGVTYDVEWSQTTTVRGSIDVHIRQCINLNTRKPVYGFVQPHDEFKARLNKRAEQIRAANNFYQ